MAGLIVTDCALIAPGAPAGAARTLTQLPAVTSVS
jgi:hypothetical protein